MFKTIPKYKGRYMINEKGEIFSLIRNRYLTPCINRSGYIESILIDKNGKRKNVKWHRAVAYTFLKKIIGKNSINHINGIKTDNRVENLEWCTTSENAIHAIKILHKHFGPQKGIMPSQLISRRKLNKKDITKIKKMLVDGLKGKEIAKLYNVSDQAIYDIKNGRCWQKPIPDKVSSDFTAF